MLQLNLLDLQQETLPYLVSLVSIIFLFSQVSIITGIVYLSEEASNKKASTSNGHINVPIGSGGKNPNDKDGKDDKKSGHRRNNAMTPEQMKKLDEFVKENFKNI